MRLLVFIAVQLTTWSAPADILHLRDGSRHYGTLIKQTNKEIIFRIEPTDGASAVRRFPAWQVKLIEQTDASRPEKTRSEAKDEISQPEPDYLQMLREAYELVDDGDLPAGLRAMRRVVNNASETMLKELDRYNHTVRGLGLADFLAATRIRATLAERNWRSFELKYATRYEGVALGNQLESLHRRLLLKIYHEQTLENWAVGHEKYVELMPDAVLMVDDARLAAGVIGARLRHDPRLKTDRAERRKLAIMRENLGRLIAKVSAMPGYTSLDRGTPAEDDPTLIEARRLAAEQATRPTEATSRPAGSQP